MQEYSLHVTVFNRTASSEVLPGWGVLGPGIGSQGPDCQSRRLLARPYPIWICPEYIVRTSMMLKPVKRPRFWMAKGIKTLPFLSSSWQTSFISGNWGRRKKHKRAAVPFLTFKCRTIQSYIYYLTIITTLTIIIFLYYKATTIISINIWL